jgi:hypothetical protein
MTDDEFLRSPIATAPLSVLLLGRGPAADLDNVLKGWIGFLRELNRPSEMIVVKAASFDLGKVEAGSFDNGNALTTPEPELRIVNTEGEGVGTLLRAGLAEAKHPLVVFTLATPHYQPADFKKFLEAIDQVDLVAGVRTGGPIPFWLRTVDFCFGWFCMILFGLPLGPRMNWLGWRSFGRRLLAQWIFGVHLHDPECIFCLVRREMLQRIVIQSDGAFAPIEFLAKANVLNAMMDEVPVTFTAEPELPAAEQPDFLDQALLVCRRPDFGPAFLPVIPPTPPFPPTVAEPPVDPSPHPS